ncbi:L-ascorbate metabolism protein UlaG (beta-lactamase superfamily) [Arthrobacter sp. SLBN-112]|jgi:L-ascorbate metabolism protein UlaG (beta-lactamase superfamily)|uniref:MBL fold metallo-hydrolase n=1 Tax=Arthrobacter sp. SLBN-112 TaxID=2768452 RepID=UPI00114FCBC3|nr:MBL fold metallo-hydrolase [Arthrobacter sp. SLBN-112]TQJ41468.1 L-ascorbate metabolism protein UlaG (beta-lactamase superfamily) [Arthrobacter sp. SLBN-112]
MKLTKYTHACIRLEKEGRVLVLDPGTFSESAEALSGAQAVLVTHEHPDHIDIKAVVAALDGDQGLVLYAPHGVAEQLRGEAPAAADRIHTVEPGQSFQAAGFDIRSFGGQHALIHPQIPVVANIGFLVDGNVYHPGDSFVIPDGIPVRTLLVPLHAPWSKSAEVVDFVIGVRAPRAFQIHDGLLNENGLGIVEGHVKRIGAKYGTEYRHLAARESVEV